MKLRLLIYSMLIGLPLVKAQVSNNNLPAGRNFTWIADNVDKSADELALYIQQHYNTKREQLYAVYNWVTTNIRYNSDSSYYFNWGVDYATKIAATLRRRKGVCENFASLFTDLAVRIGVQSYVVHGYGAGSSDNRNVAHSWCAVNLDNEWYLCDPTWDAGQSGNFYYYLIDPSVFVQTHIPFDPIWQLLEKPLGYKNAGIKNKPSFNYKDSIKIFLQSDSLQQFLAIERRMKQEENSKEMFKIWQSYNRMNIAIIGGEENMRLYNGAVDDLNKALDLFNAFINYRNNRFLPSKSDAVIEAMLKPAGKFIATAKTQLDSIGMIMENFQYDTESIRRRLDSLSMRIEEQQSFLKKYLAGGAAEREKMMYQ